MSLQVSGGPVTIRGGPGPAGSPSLASRGVGRRRAPLLLATLLTALVLTGCTAGGGGGGGDAAGDQSAGAQAAPAAEVADAAESGDAAASGDAAVAEPAAAADRQVVTTGEVTVVVDDPRGAVDDVVALVEGRGGRVDERAEQGAVGPGEGSDPAEDGDPSEGSDPAGPGGPAEATASLTVRVPAAEVTATLDALAALGEVSSVALSSADVTAQARDLDARIGALRTSTARLEGLVADAATTADVLAAEQLLTDRQGQLEALVAERAALGEQVDLSTLRLQLVGPGEEAPAPAPGPQGFLDGLGVGWGALLRATGAALLVSGVLAPWAAATAVVVAAAVGLRRWRRRVVAGAAAG